MSVVPFRWQGVTRVERLRERTLAQSLVWLRNWAASPEPAACTVDGLSAQRHADAKASDQWLSVTGEHGTLWMRAAPNAAEQLGRCLAGTRVADNQGLAAGIGRRALADLATQLVGGGAAGDFKDTSRPAAGALDVRHVVAGFAWVLDDARFELYFDAGLCDALMPVTTKSIDLTSRTEAIRPAQVTLHAVLDLGLTNLEDTLVLRPGEVIKTGIALNQSVSVQTESGETLFVGALVAHEGHRALRCTRTPTA
ncbi:MAG: hypothetical protein ACREPE_03830 [Lysobacter sp.]